jgi:hypothetical protein
MARVLGSKGSRGLLVVTVLAIVFAVAPLVHSHDAACAHDTSGLCSASEADRMDKGDSIYDPAHEPGPAGPAPAQAADARTARFELLGHYDPGTGSLGDVWAHDGVAYLGSWVIGCLGQGIRAISLDDPRDPTLLSTFADRAGEPDVAGSWTEKVIVQRIRTPHFRGDLAAVSFQNCSASDTTSFRGFGIYDVTDPADPERLALVPTASRGSHEIWLEPRPGGAFVYTAAQRAEERTSVGGIGGEKDFQVWDVSDPTQPIRVAQWGAWEELGLAPNTVRGIGQVHSVIGDGRYAYLAHWDHGTIVIDMRDPGDPVFVGKTGFGPLEEGNAHSNAVWNGGRLMVQNDEDFNPAPSATREQAWGYSRFYDISDPANPRPLGTFELPTTRQFPASDAGDYTVHDPKVRGNTMFYSWYAEGIVAVDVAGIANGREPRFVAQWKPPLPNPDPSGGLPDTAQVWGVALERDLVLASDQNSGLYVLKLRRGPAGG